MERMRERQMVTTKLGVGAEGAGMVGVEAGKRGHKGQRTVRKR